MQLKEWQIAQPPVKGQRPDGKPIEGDNFTPEVRSQYIDEWRAKEAAAQIEKDLKGKGLTGKVEIGLVDSSTMDAGEARRLWLLRFTLGGVDYEVPAGSVFAEISAPYGWADADRKYYRIGVDERRTTDNSLAGFLVPVPMGVRPDGLPLQWNPESIPVEPVMVRPFDPTHGMGGTDTLNAGEALREIRDGVRELLKR